MVVIKETRSVLTSLYGKNFISHINDFSTVVGYSVEEEGGEVKVEFNPDRPDLFSFTSLYNAMQIYYGKKSWKPVSFKGTQLEFLIEKNVRRLRPYTIGFCCQGNEIGEHFRDLIDYQERIHLSVGKDRSKVSIGIHDTTGLKGPIYYRAYKSDNVRFTTYDGEVTGTAEEIISKHPKGQEYSHLIPSGNEVPIIEDSMHQVLSMPPVINGHTTAVSSRTKSFFVDITGTDITALKDAFFLLAYFFSNLDYRLSLSNAGDISADLKTDGRKIMIGQPAIMELTGTRIPNEKVTEILKKMGYGSSTEGENVIALVPGNRSDVMGPADVIEDIAKGYGYDKIPAVQPQLSVIGRELEKKPLLNLVREVMIGIGHQEIMSFVVTSRKFYENMNYGGSVEVRNPKSLDFSVVRDRLILGSLDFLRRNRRRNLPQNIFEIGEVLIGAKQQTNLCLLKANSRSGYSDIKQSIDALMMRVGVKDFTIVTEKSDLLIEGRGGTVKVRGKNIGIIGEVHPDTLDSFDLRNPVSYAELNLSRLFAVLNKQT